jgi:hypothetical protein
MSDPKDFEDTDGAQGFVDDATQRHVRTLLSMPGRWDRAEYLAGVRRNEGPIRAGRVSDEYARARGLLQEGVR